MTLGPELAPTPKRSHLLYRARLIAAADVRAAADLLEFAEAGGLAALNDPGVVTGAQR